MVKEYFKRYKGELLKCQIRGTRCETTVYPDCLPGQTVNLKGIFNGMVTFQLTLIQAYGQFQKTQTKVGDIY